MAFCVTINGQQRTFADLDIPVSLAAIVTELGLKSDRIAVEHNGTIVPRLTWSNVELEQGDKLEIVHFVGGGCPGPFSCVA